VNSPALRAFDGPEALARYGAEWLCACAAASRGDCAVCLSGGSTPRRLYELLTQPPLAARMPWRRIHWFFGDERFVPHDHPASNFRMVRHALFSRAPIPAGHVHPIPTDRASARDAAVAYEETLKRFYGADVIDSGRPLFAATLLGLGDDGHTASLFPGHPAVDDDRHWAVAVEGVAAPARVSLTLAALNSSAEAAFLVSGESKRAILARVLGGEAVLPAARIRPSGHLHWFVERTALPAELPQGVTR
jgi:6-phosphogluconolactonase